MVNSRPCAFVAAQAFVHRCPSRSNLIHAGPETRERWLPRPDPHTLTAAPLADLKVESIWERGRCASFFSLKPAP
jgi:hypothetical protein